MTMTPSLAVPEAALDSITELLPGMMYWLWMDVDGVMRFAYVSKIVEDWFGVDRQALKLDGAPLLALIHPDDYGWVLAESFEAAESESLWCAEFRMRLPGGETLWLEARDRPKCLDNGGVLWTGYANQIGERKRLEDELRSSEARFRAIVENASDLIFTLDQQGPFTYASPAWLSATGAEPQQLAAKLAAALIHPEDVGAFDRFVSRAFDSGTKQGRGEFRFRNPGGDYRWYSVNVSPLLVIEGGVNQCLGVARDIDDNKQMVAKIDHLASFDQLTDLPSRGLFSRRLNQAIDDARRANSRLAVLFIDIDNFKEINDSRGHACGDWLLANIAARISACLRSSDTAGRIGGDEFVVLVPGLSAGDKGRDSALSLAERIRRAVALPFDDLEIRVSCSLGIALYPNDGSDELTLMKNADTAMYTAKTKGRNQIYFYDPDSNPVETGC